MEKLVEREKKKKKKKKKKRTLMNIAPEEDSKT